MKVALAQINSLVGGFEENTNKIIHFCKDALAKNVDLIIFPELAVCGYPPEDLLFKPHFLDRNLDAVKKIASACPDIAIIVGFAEARGRDCFNSAAFLIGSQIEHIYSKSLLPNFSVFDEQRYFKPGNKPLIIKFKDIDIAFSICRDIWVTDWQADLYKGLGNIDLLVNISASPYHIGKDKIRKQLAFDIINRLGCAVSYTNLVGGQDELVYDGRSFVVAPDQTIAATAAAYQEDTLIFNIDKASGNTTLRTEAAHKEPEIDIEHDVYKALVLGTKDYAIKNGFKKVLLGISGGIDSSVVAAVAAEALGPENVTGITMPTRFNSNETINDAEKLAQNLGINFLNIPIEKTLDAFNAAMTPVKDWNDAGVAYENLQARIRGTILMSLSNQLNALVLTSGNKSETAVGYATLYGDTAGGFAVIKDVPKTLIYKLATFINKLKGKEIIPASVIERPPTAELRDNQKDTDSLPDYDTLDSILEKYVENDNSISQIVRMGFDPKLVKKIITMVDQNEYKRRQSPPGIKITARAFGKDRRLPITNSYRDDSQS